MKLHVEITIFISMFKDLSIIIFRKKALDKISTIPPPKERTKQLCCISYEAFIILELFMVGEGSE